MPYTFPRKRRSRRGLAGAALVATAALLFAGAGIADDAARGREQRGGGGDGVSLADPTRPVAEITRTSVTLQWFTRAPCETRVQIREGKLPMVVFRGAGRGAAAADAGDAWASARVVAGPPGERTFHVLRIDGLNPGVRYFYRLYDPDADPTPLETRWGARKPWRREWAVSTEAPAGRKTVIRVPVKVLLMPNVAHVASAHDAGTGKLVAPPPAKMTEAELARLSEEYAVASRFFWVNSGMRYWVDFRVFVDDRWQRWGDAPAAGKVPRNAFYKGWPLSRSYAGQEFVPPGGGTWTIVDTRDPRRVTNTPVVEESPYPGQIEQAFVRRWNPGTARWEYRNSGGGTFGVDGFGRGIPGRSQYLGGGDTAWLAAHEFHHQMESQGEFSFADREDDRIVFDHPAPRRRTPRPDGTWDDNAWNTAGRHGEHWDVLAFWDRTLTDAQWLRIYFGETVTVADADGDGVPDDDPRLPLDEKRWGSRPDTAKTDGRMNDLAKVMLSTWAPGPLQSTFRKPEFQAILPSPAAPDSDGDGLPDDIDPYPLYPYPPFIWPCTAAVDGDAGEWANVPVGGRMDRGGVRLTFQQAHDDRAYYGLVRLSGPWKHLRITLDGEGEGVFSGRGVEYLEVTRAAEPDAAPSIRKPPYARAVVGVAAAPPEPAAGGDGGGDGSAAFEFSLPNRGEGPWFWDKAGREIGVAIEVRDDEGRVYSVYEPYRLFYARMLERAGRDPLPPGAPAELTREQATRVLLPGDPALKFTGTGWKRGKKRLVHAGEAESLAFVDGLSAADFDLWMRFEAKQDAILAAFAPETASPNAGSDYVAFVGGYNNTVTRLRLFGREIGDADAVLTPGIHTMQLSRRNGAVWCLFDGKPILYAADPDPQKTIDRLAVIGGYHGGQIVHEIRVRIHAP